MAKFNWRAIFIVTYAFAALLVGTLMQAWDASRCSPNADRPYIYLIAGAAWPALGVVVFATILAGQHLPNSCATT